LVKMRRAVRLVAVFTLVIAGGALGGEGTALAAGGDLDPSFGDRGLVTTTEFYEGLGSAGAIALQPDGKIVVAGYLWSDPEMEFAVARFDVDGGLDPTFAGDGTASTIFSTGEDCYEEARSVLVQSDGKIVAVGVSSCKWSEPDREASGLFLLARYNVDGTPDGTFGENGTVMTSFGDPADCSARAEAAALQPDGKIVVAGTGGCTQAGIDDRFAIARYDTDGALDPGFSDDGMVMTNFTIQYDKLTDVDVQPDGKIVAGGTAAYWMVETDMLESRAALARYNPDGTLDDTFGRNGKVKTSFHSRRCPGANESYDLEIQPDGRIVQGGSAACAASAGDLPHPRWALSRYRPNGTLDRTFGRNGRVVSIFSDATWGDWMSAGIEIQANGRIVAGGSTARHASRFMLVRYRADGRLDPRFGDDGRVQTVFGTGPGCASGGWGGLAIRSDRKIVATGGGGCFRSFVMARFLPS
jgi:uncharacterized delta-60 repeat protein